MKNNRRNILHLIPGSILVVVILLIFTINVATSASLHLNYSSAFSSVKAFSYAIVEDLENKVTIDTLDRTSLVDSIEVIPAQYQEVKKITLVRSGSGHKAKNKDYWVLRDSVQFYHEGAYMDCDSAYINYQTNTFEAFGRVRINEGDSIFVNGRHLYYDGNTKVAKLRDNVSVLKDSSVLTTNHLDFDRTNNVSYYFSGGKLVDEDNVLTSRKGQYDLNLNNALFSDSVKLDNPRFVLTSDTLGYNTNTKIADILGPSLIEADSTIIRSSKGWYNTETEYSELLDRSVIEQPDNSYMTGDTIDYNRITGVGIVRGHMHLQDNSRNVIMQGNYGYYDEPKGYALARDSALCIDYSQSDSLFLHASELILETDSTYKKVTASDNVRFYRTDIQGVCDTLIYNSADSTIYMIKDPALWHESQQISGVKINILLGDSSTVKLLNVIDNAFCLEDRLQDDQFNQLSGRDIKAFFEGGAIRQILVEGNAQAIYYTDEQQEDFVISRLYKSQSAFISIVFKDNEVYKVIGYPSPESVFYPLILCPPEERKLEGFIFLKNVRPINRDDVFRRPIQQGDDKPRDTRSSRFRK